MTYIGNARSLLILGPNTRDDLFPEKDSLGNWKNIFELSQEVPGAFEENVTVVRQKYITKQLVSNTTEITITNLSQDKSLLTCSDSSISTVLDFAKPGDSLIISVPSNISNPFHGTFTIDSIKYESGQTEITLLTPGISSTLNTSNPKVSVDIRLGYFDVWSILDANTDFTIVSLGNKTNSHISLTEAPTVDDKVYVLHKGQATYNFVPTAKSVGPEQLSDNLRTFTCDRYVGDNNKTSFEISGTENPASQVVDAKSLLVTIDGEVQDSSYTTTSGTYVSGAWELGTSNTSGKQLVIFATAPQTGKAIRILNLGFSTVSRRAAFAVGQASTPGIGTVGEAQLKDDSVTESKLRNLSISTDKLKDNSVTGSKILLDNNTSVRSKTSSGGTFGIIKLNSSNITEILASSEVAVNIAGSKSLTINSSDVYPETTNVVSLGTNTNRFKNLNLTGNIVLDGSVTVAGTVDGVDVSELNNTVNQIKSLINAGTFSPIGTIMIWSSSTVPSGWLRCDGSEVSTYTYKELHSIISNQFNSSGSAYQAGITDVPSATTKFYLPDLVTRFPVGANEAASNIGTVESPQLSKANRTIDHTHTGAPHTHTFNHTHGVPSHYHENVPYLSYTSPTVNTPNPDALYIDISGKHTTRIDHNHTGNVPTVTAAGEQDNISWDATSGRGLHDHSGNTGTPIEATTTNAATLNHTHRSWPATAYANDRLPLDALNIDHNHDFYNYRGGSNITLEEIGVRGTNSTSSVHDNDSSQGKNIISSAAESGTTRAIAFNIKTATRQLRPTPYSPPFTTAGPNESLSHRHSWSVTSQGGHDHSGGLKMYYKSVDAHGTGSSSTNDLRGVHTHGAPSIKGKLGDTSGVSGNSTIVTTTPTLDNGQSPKTSSANFSDGTGSSVSPHQVVNFIIKVTNPQVI